MPASPNPTLPGCSELESGLGTCIGSNLILNVTIWNERNNITLASVSALIDGDVNITKLNILDSHLLVQGNLSGQNSSLSLTRTILQITTSLYLSDSTIRMDIHSRIICGIVDMRNTTITLELPTNTSIGEYPIITSNNTITNFPTISAKPVECLNSQPIKSSKIISVLVSTDPKCSNSDNTFSIIIGVVCGSLFLIIVISGAYLSWKRKQTIEKSVSKLMEKVNMEK
uniref:Uncharacterized protein n=1 Tax=Arcella intermedia TaxID=1963864 RepID=A0A6B2LDW3_9EUKA